MPILSSNNMDSEDYDLLKSIFTSASEGIIMINKTGAILLSNPSAERLFQYKAADMQLLTLEDLVPERFRMMHVQHREKYFESPKSRSMASGYDLWALRKDGSEFPVEISLSCIEMDGDTLAVAFIIDVTLRKQQEQDLKESRLKLKEYADKLQERVRERTRELEHLNLGLQSQVQERKMAESALIETQKLYNAIAENFPNGVISVLDLDFKYIFINGAELKDRGWDPDKLIGRSYLAMAKQPGLLQAQLQALRENEQEFSQQLSLNGHTYEVHGVPLYDDENDLYQMLLVEENITKQKKAEEEILRSLQKEKELNELKSRFVSMASHEFRTPLSTILSSVSLIGKYPDDARDKREKHIDRIKSAISNMTNILNDFLSIGKLEEGKIEYCPEKINLGDMLRHVSDEMEGTLKEGQSIEILGPEPELETDPKLMKNVFINLLSNASKYSDEGKLITVRVKDKTQNYLVEVIDRGYGIPEDEQSNIFTRFYRAGNATNIQGTGLGLNIVKKYVELLQGSITFESRLNEGTKFKLTIPKR
ncbi:MAG: PAS domain S-box protein [Bacteroidota bacterium]